MSQSQRATRRVYLYYPHKPLRIELRKLLYYYCLDESMSYCSKCGAENEGDAIYCASCGASLQGSRGGDRNWEEELERRAEHFGDSAERFGRRMENECFGLPRNSSIFGILIGLAIILFGASTLLGLNIDFGPFVMIVIGVLIIAGVLYRQNQERL